MISRRNALRSSLVLALGISMGGGIYFSRTEEVLVKMGELKYAERKILRANGFSACTVLIVRHEDSAVFAHVLPQESRALNKEHTRLISIENAVQECVRELGSRGINVNNCEATVNAGNADSYARLITDLKKYGIKIRDVYLDMEAKEKNFIYDPMKNELRVENIR